MKPIINLYSFSVIILPINYFIGYSVCSFADYGTVPNGTSPTLFNQEDEVIQLDEGTFNDTIFCTSKTEKDVPCGASYIINFYSDWCGHCRSYAPIYRSLAKDIYNWNQVIKLTSINCADPFNHQICRINGVAYYPFLKYYFHNITEEQAYANTEKNGINLRAYTSHSEMRDQIINTLLEEYSHNHYKNWPKFEPIGKIETYGDLWEGVNQNISLMALVFENDLNSLTGAQLLLDLETYKKQLIVRRCINNPLINALNIRDFPTIVIFRRGERIPVFTSEIRRLLFTEFERFLVNETSNHIGLLKHQTFASRSRKIPESCNEHPENCKKLYYVSELDMLKALKSALYYDVDIVGEQLAGSNLTSLYSFVNLLATHIPYTTRLSESVKEESLNSSGRARAVFNHMRNYLENRGMKTSLSVDQWKSEFSKAEADQGRPFPELQDNWDHCKGYEIICTNISAKIMLSELKIDPNVERHLRYTCGLWVAFHAVTVNAYRNSLKNGTNFSPTQVMLAIKDWVESFFACDHCRKHFNKMTTKTLSIEKNIDRNEDVFLYLWKAHNLVNARLRGRETEDVRFPKYQFPGKFLCEDCRLVADDESSFSQPAVEKFLLQYYTAIKPI